MINRAFILFCFLYILSACYGYIEFHPDRATVAFAVALTSFLLQIYIFVMQKRYEKSEFRLTSALDAFEETHKLLKDKNNDRVKWATAARALQRGVRIASGITEQVHNDVLEVHRDRYRLIFGDILGYYNQDITASFFYGAPPSIVDIDEAAKYSSRKENGVSRLQGLNENTLKIIWDFAEFPKEYVDPISDIKLFPDGEVNEYFNVMKYEGLFEYLRHTRQFHTSDGELFPITQPKSEPDIDSVWWKRLIQFFSAKGKNSP